VIAHISTTVIESQQISIILILSFKVKNLMKNACIQWKKPHYKRKHKQVFIPTDRELQLAVNTGHKESFVFVKFLYETGARSNEAQRLEWDDLDKENNLVSIKASKNGNARTLKISKELTDLLVSLPKRENEKTVFRKKSKNSRSLAFHNRMLRLAKNSRQLKAKDFPSHIATQ